MPKLLGGFLALALLAGAVSCGGGGGGGQACAAPTQDVTGTWSVEDTSTSAECGVEMTAYSLTALQIGSDITVTDTTGRQYTGFICGDRVEAYTPFSYPEDGGTTTVQDLVFTVTGNALSGTSRWSWTDGSDACSGTSAFTATR